jgi:hypothetical protein
MVYLDNASRTALKGDLTKLYQSAVADHQAVARIRALQRARAMSTMHH